MCTRNATNHFRHNPTTMPPTSTMPPRSGFEKELDGTPVPPAHLTTDGTPSTPNARSHLSLSTYSRPLYQDACACLTHVVGHCLCCTCATLDPTAASTSHLGSPPLSICLSAGWDYPHGEGNNSEWFSPLDGLCRRNYGSLCLDTWVLHLRVNTALGMYRTSGRLTPLVGHSTSASRTWGHTCACRTRGRLGSGCIRWHRLQR